MTPLSARSFGKDAGRAKDHGNRRHVLSSSLSGTFFWTFILPVIDTLLLLSCLMGSSFLRLGYVPGAEHGRGGWASYIIYALCILCGTAVSGAYKKPVRLRRLNAAAEFILGTLLATLGALFLIYVVFLGADRVVQESRAVLLISSAVFVIAALLTREIFYRIQGHLSLTSPYLLIGSKDSLHEFSTTYAGTGLKNPLVPRTLADLPSASGESAASEGNSTFWEDVGLRFEAVILTDPPEQMDAALIEKLVRMHFSSLPVLTLNAFYSLMWRQVPTLNLSPSWVFEQDFSLSERSQYRFIKRGFDIVLSLLLNVLSGDMSLIGPRPEWERLVSAYEKEIPFYHLRHLVKPGITGWAQLNFRYGENLKDALEKLRFDLYYIRFYSPVLDLEIVLKTILYVFTFRGR